MNEEIARRLGEIEETRDFFVVGKKVARVDALDAVLGRPVYTADLITGRPLYVRAVRSTYPHALIKSIDFSKALETPSIKAVYTHRDIPGVNDAGSLIPDRPLLAYDKVRHIGEALALVVGEDLERVEEAVDQVAVDYDPLPVVSSPGEAMRPGAPRVQDRDNVVTHFKIRKGDVEKGFKQSHLVLERTYRTQHIDGLPLEIEVAYAFWSHDSILTCISTMQNPFDVYNKVAQILGIPKEKLRIIQAATGGGFGPKSDETPIDVSAYACLATLKTGRPAVSAFTREEAMTVQCKRHPFEITHRVGVTRDGRLMAWKSTLIEDTGAYVSKGHLVIGRATFHCTGPYEVPNIWADGYCVLTNNTMAGSTRGFGAPQSHFAAEMMMDELAAELGLSPAEIRRRNVLRVGSLTATSQKVDDPGLEICFQKALELTDFERRYGELKAQSGWPIRRGIGLALLYHGNTLGPEGDDFATVTTRVERDGSITVQTGLTEFGTGAITSLILVTAETFGISPSRIRLERPDTLAIPNSGPTVASRTTAIGGRAALDAALKIRQVIANVASEILGCRAEDLTFHQSKIYPKGQPSKYVSWEEAVAECYRLGLDLKATGYYIAPPTKWDPETGQGSPYNQYTYGALVTEVEVDMETGVVRVDRMTAVYDVGRAINPLGLVSTYESGSIMGLGYALLEHIIHENGRLLNPNLHTYIIPTSVDAPSRIESIMVESPGPMGVFGAKAMGEIPVVLPAASIANAVANATGVFIRQLPLRPDRVLTAISQS
jgi:CO/xanthine dehydrogenase Mo-binding subunit